MEKHKRIETLEREFSKEQILRSNRYRAFRDVLSVLLEEGTSYTLTQVDGRLQDFGSARVQ